MQLVLGNQITPVGAFELFEEDGSFIDEGEGDFNKHGNDSWAYDQRGFDFIMRDQYGHNGRINHQIFNNSPRPKHQRVILKPAASDKIAEEKAAKEAAKVEVKEEEKLSEEDNKEKKEVKS
jgi:hypothetical protein